MKAGEVMDAVESLAAAAGIDLAAGIGRDWFEIEQSLGGLTLPGDYKRVVDGFPHGRFKDSVTVIRPGLRGGSKDEYLGFYENRLEDLRVWRTDGDRSYPYPIYPETGGVLPWGVSAGGELLFWLTADDDPDKWPVIWADEGYLNWHQRRVSMSEFLLQLVSDPPANVAALVTGDIASAPAFRVIDAVPTAGPGAVALQQLSAMWNRASAPEPADESDALLASVGADEAEAVDRDWATLERQWGFEFPEDYRTFYDTLGPGIFCDIAIVGPDAPDGWNVFNLLRAGRQQVLASGADHIKFHPDAGGIIPWGLAPDRWLFGWRYQNSDPASWTVTALGPRNDTVDFPDLSFSSFLVRYFDPNFASAVFLLDRELWSGPPVFRSAWE